MHFISPEIQWNPQVNTRTNRGEIWGNVVAENLPEGEYGVEVSVGVGNYTRGAVKALNIRSDKQNRQRSNVYGEGTIFTAAPSVPDVVLWSPENPKLYPVRVRLYREGKVVDQVESYVAFRTVGIKDGRLTLNDKPIFYRGVLDQGYWPDGILTPPSDAAIKADVELVKKLGFNMARKHVKIEDPRWYYWCDKLGVLVWQDMPSSHNLGTQEAKDNFVHEWTEAMATVRNHPSVVHWIPFNENWGDPKEFQDSVVTLTRQIDPSRPITDASGWTQRGLTDVIDAHDYSNNLKRQGVHNPVKPKVVGEYGGIALPIQGHTWSSGWGYQSVRDADGLIQRIRYQTSQLFEAEHLSGFVYTQLTDVEQELNGLMTYDRQPKAPFAKIAAVFNGTDRSIGDEMNFIRDWLVLGPIPGNTSLKSGSNDDANRRQMEQLLNEIPAGVNFNGEAPKDNDPIVTGTGHVLRWKQMHLTEDAIDFHHVFGGNTENAIAYAVAIVDSPKATQKAALYLGSDDGVVVTVNGVEVWRNAVIRGVGIDSDIVPHIRLKQGRNILVFKVGQGIGGWGLAARIEMPH